MTPEALGRELRDLLERGALEQIRPPGLGSTVDRHRRLVELGRRDLSLARMAEPHADALAVLADTGRAPHPGALYGVWASESPAHTLRVDRTSGDLQLDGQKAFCGGASACDRALVTATGADGKPLMVELDLVTGRRDGTLRVDPSSWVTPAFGSTDTAVVSFDQHRVDDADVIGDVSCYLDRPGFWHCAIGPAAVWAGGAIALVEAAEQVVANREGRTDGASAHDRAQLGAMRSLRWAMLAELDAAGSQIDADAGDRDTARVRALTVRHLVERQATEVLDLFGRTVGPRPLAFDPDVVRRLQELQLYLRQCHGAVDLEVIGSPGTVAERTR